MATSTWKRDSQEHEKYSSYYFFVVQRHHVPVALCASAATVRKP